MEETNEEAIYKEDTGIIGSTRNFEEAKSLFCTKVGVHLVVLDEELAKLASNNALGYCNGYEEAIKDLQDCRLKKVLNGLDQSSQMKNMFWHKINELRADGIISQEVRDILNDAGAEMEFKAYDQILNLLETKCNCRIKNRS